MWSQYSLDCRGSLKKNSLRNSSPEEITPPIPFSEKATEFQKKIYFCFIDYANAFDCVDHNKLENSEDMGIPDYLTCLLRNLYEAQEARVRTRHGTTDWFQIGKGVHQGCICHPAYLTYMQSTS